MNTSKNLDLQRWNESFNDALGSRESYLSQDWRETMYRYVVSGFPPGGFFTSVLANDLIGAASHSHPSNNWSEIMTLCKWILNSAPRDCWGSYEKIEAWIKLTQEGRRAACEHARLLPTMWEVLSTPENLTN